MTDTERTDLNIKLAEILGATWVSVGGNVTHSHHLRLPSGSTVWAVRFRGSQQEEWRHGPDFTSSIDAQAPLVKLVEERGLCWLWQNALFQLMFGDTPDYTLPSVSDDGIDRHILGAAIDAPALIRAQAFLEVLK